MNGNKIENGNDLRTFIITSYYKTVSMAMRTESFDLLKIYQEIPSSLKNQIQEDLKNKEQENDTIQYKNTDMTNTTTNTQSKILNTSHKKLLTMEKELGIIEFLSGGMPEATLIGNIQKLEDCIINPVSYRLDKKFNENQDKKQECIKVHFKATYEKDKIHAIIMKKSDYKQYFVRYFNRMLKNRAQKYVITNLKIGYYQGQILFILQPSSYLLQVTDEFYHKKLKSIQKIKQFKFSNISLTKVYTIDELQSLGKQGLALNQIRQRFQQRQRQPISICGLLQITEQDYQFKSKKTKQIVAWVYQLIYTKTIEEVGRCKVIIRYNPTEQNEVNNLIINNHAYLLANPEMIITENGNVLYVFNNVINNESIIKLSDQPISVQWHKLYALSVMQDTTYENMKQLFCSQENSIGKELSIQNWTIENFKVIPVSKLFQKSLNRNLIKLQLTLEQIDIIYGSIRCSICLSQIKEDQCYKQCKGSNHILQLWGAIRAADQTSPCIVSLEHMELIEFLQMFDYLEEIEKVVRLHMRQYKSGLTILNSNKEKKKPNEDPLFKIKQKLRFKYQQKIVIGYANLNLDKTFREGLSEDEQLDFHNSFQNTKKFIQQKKIFPNGVIEKRHQELHFIPYIKALKILSTNSDKN